jgi:GH25 family lysozyme M1 (1,4-beta-N-acetylmuramidase)
MKPIIDISHHQNPGDIDYDRLAEQVSGVIIRAAYGSRSDTAVERHYAEFTSRHTPVGIYHYITEYMPVQSQVDKLKSVLAGKIYPLGLWTDVELEAGATPLRKRTVDEYIRLVESQVAPIDGIYTSRHYWSLIMGGAYYTDKKLWVAAHYYQIPPIPTGWDSWWLWQHSHTGRLPGYNGDLDLNHFYGTEQQYADWVGGEETPPEPVPPEEQVKLFDAKVVTKPGYRLRTRFTPGGNLRPEADWLQSQAIVPVYEISGTGWWRVGHETWASSEWMQRLDLPLPITEKYYGALYWQRDPRWKDKPLGTSGTIGSYGCVMTAETNALNQLGIVTNPVVNNAWRTANGGYHNGNLIVWEKVTEQHPDIIWEGKTWNPTDAQIKQKISNGCPLVMLVDHNEGTPALNEHWVNSIPSPVDDGAIWIHDPWDNVTIRLRDRYKKPIQQFSSYRKQM